MESSISRAAVLLVLALLGGAAGCQRAAPTPLAVEQIEQTTPAAQRQRASTADQQRPRERLVEENWYAFYLRDKKIGHGHNRVTAVERDGQQVLRIELIQHMSLLRDMEPVEQTIRLESWESPTGQVLELRTHSSDGHTTRAIPKDGRLQITLTTSGTTQQQTIPWDSQGRGFYAEHQVLAAEPLKPGRVLTFQSFIPVLNVAGETRLNVQDWEEVETPFGSERLMRVESRLTAGRVQLDSVLWCDNKGQVRKYFLPQSELTAHRTVKKLALAQNDDVDLYRELNVKVAKPLRQPHATRRAIYRAHLRSGADPLRIFVSDHSQRVSPLGSGEAQIEVIAIGASTPALEETPQSPPTPADSAPNALIQSDDRRIQVLLASVPGDSHDPLEWALACEKFVAQTIDNKVLTEAFSTAAEVAETRTGDCTEHAVLTAALCRAHGIPTRVATGLVAYQDVYAFHMWNEIWTGDRWVPIDATLGRGGIGAGHIKLNVSSLEGVSPFAALAPVLEVMGSLELEVVSFE